MSCFWKHKWGEWRNTENGGRLNGLNHGIIIRPNIGSWQEQKRVCKRCGMLELRTVRNLF